MYPWSYSSFFNSKVHTTVHPSYLSQSTLCFLQLVQIVFVTYNQGLWQKLLCSQWQPLAVYQKGPRAKLITVERQEIIRRKEGEAQGNHPWMRKSEPSLSSSDLWWWLTSDKHLLKTELGAPGTPLVTATQCQANSSGLRCSVCFKLMCTFSCAVTSLAPGCFKLANSTAPTCYS